MGDNLHSLFHLIQGRSVAQNYELMLAGVDTIHAYQLHILGWRLNDWSYAVFQFIDENDALQFKLTYG